MTYYSEAVEQYKKLNFVARSSSAVFWGTDWLYDTPLTELTESSAVECVVYNRSIKGLKIKDCEKVIDACVFDINPDKLFISIGENDIKAEGFDEREFGEKYEWLLYTIHTRCNCNIYILPVKPDVNTTINDTLKNIAERHGCQYIELNGCGSSCLKLFSRIRRFLRRDFLTFTEAMTM